MGCNINTGNKQAAPRGFKFLPVVGDGAGPARSKRGVSDATILRHLVLVMAAPIIMSARMFIRFSIAYSAPDKMRMSSCHFAQSSL